MDNSKLKISLIQSNIAWENTQANISKYNKLLELIGETDMVVFPEMFTTGFSMNTVNTAETIDGESVSWMKEMSEKYNSAFIGSLPVKESGNVCNRLVMVSGQDVNSYNKRHLFKPGQEHGSFIRGEERKVFNFGDWRILPQICYDLRFPVWSRNMNDYDIAIYVANWPAARTDVWQTLLKARAIENQCYVVGVNRVGTDGNDTSYSGSSMVVDPRGKVILDLGKNENYDTVELSLDQLNSFRKAFPVLDDRDDFLLK